MSSYLQDRDRYRRSALRCLRLSLRWGRRPANTYASLASVPATPQLHHRVVIWIALDGAVCAHVTFFAVAQFSVHLGRTAYRPEGKCVVLDPSAQRAGDPARLDQVVSDVLCPEPPRQFSEIRDDDRDIFNDRMRGALDAALARKWQRDLTTLLQRLTDEPPRYDWQRRQRIRTALRPFLQQVLNVVVKTVEMLRGVEGLSDFCDTITADDPESGTGISTQLMCLVELTLEGMVDRIAEYMSADRLSAEALRLVLDGGEGIQIACHYTMSLAGQLFQYEFGDFRPEPVLARGT
jgi:hypothetical protein